MPLTKYIFCRLPQFGWRGVRGNCYEHSKAQVQNLSGRNIFRNKSGWSITQKFFVVVFGTSGIGFALKNQFHQSVLTAECQGTLLYPPASADNDLEKREEEVEEEESETTEMHFPWREFLKLLIPDIWYLLGAVTVSNSFLESSWERM